MCWNVKNKGCICYIPALSILTLDLRSFRIAVSCRRFATTYKSSLTLEDGARSGSMKFYHLSSPKNKKAWSFTSSLPYIFMTWSVNPWAAIDFISQIYIWDQWSVQNRKGSIWKLCGLYVIHCSSYRRLALGVMLHMVFVLDLWGLGYHLVYCEIMECGYLIQPLSEFVCQ
jgi:hypothetical protein